MQISRSAFVFCPIRRSEVFVVKFSSDLDAGISIRIILREKNLLQQQCGRICFALYLPY